MGPGSVRNSEMSVTQKKYRRASESVRPAQYSASFVQQIAAGANVCFDFFSLLPNITNCGLGNTKSLRKQPLGLAVSNLCDDLKLLFQRYNSALLLGRHYRTRTTYLYIVQNNYNAKNK